MDREILKNIMLEIGVDPKYVEMPSIMERVFDSIYFCRTPNEIKECITVREDGKVEVNGVTKLVFGTKNGETFIEIRKDPKKEFGFYDIAIIDEYGMDQRYEPSWNDDPSPYWDRSIPYYTYRRNLGEKSIDVEDYFSGSHLYEEREVKPDNGDFDIFRNARTWEENKEFLCAHYPLAREWFEKRDRQKTVSEYEEEYDRLMSLNSKIQNDIDIERKYIESEQAKHEILSQRVSRLQQMLKRTLEFCESIKRSPIGKVFFRDEARQLPSKREIERDIEDKYESDAR